MSSMPEREAPGQWGASTPSGTGDRTGTPGQHDMPGPEFGGLPPGGTHEGGYGEDPYGSRWSGRGGWGSPVDQHETKVVGRRVVQYVIDYILAGIIPAIAYWLLDRGSGFLHGFGWTVATLITMVVYLWYWVLRPNSRHGQTFGMQLLGVRIISKDGGPANMLQYFVRAILLIVDTFFFGLVGLITMMASGYHQRVGDHAARTLVVAAGYGESVTSHADSEQTGGYRVEDERLARPDTYADQFYGQDFAPGSGRSDEDARGSQGLCGGSLSHALSDTVLGVGSRAPRAVTCTVAPHP